MTVDELILVEIEKDKVGWIDRVNIHMEMILKKENRNKNLQLHMVIHYYTRNQVS